jgi:NADPH:quinone reductase-like Zn-dependent oxidoreductase
VKLRYKIASGTLLLIAAAVAALGLALSHDSACEIAPEVAAPSPSMKAVVQRCYGSPDVLALEDVAKPAPGDDEVLVKVRAASVNPVDWHALRGKPYVMRLGSGLGRPQISRIGTDFAGTVEAVGKNVTRFQPGDDVFGARKGAFAQYVTVLAERTIVRKPGNVTFEEAAAVPVAAITALQALRDSGRIRAGQEVLINGASGGVGTFAVQIAKAFGAEVTGVCSTRNLALVRDIGADYVIDYTKENFTQNEKRYDLILDTVATHSPSDYRRALKPDGVLVMVGALSDGPWLGPLLPMIELYAYAAFVDEQLVTMFATLNQDDLATLRDLMEAGRVKTVIDRRYTSNEIPDAIRYLEQGHARGKVVVSFP